MIPDSIYPLAFVLASWRLSTMVTSEDGPAAIFSRLRMRLDADISEPGSLGDLISCIRCFSVWCCLVLVMADYLWHDLMEAPVIVLAASAVVIIIESVVNRVDSVDDLSPPK